MNIRVVYGLHPSRCYGRSLGIDPLLPPKKCFYNCIYCPMGRTIIQTSEPKPLINPKKLITELEEYISKNGCLFETVYFWGMGDPLLNHYTPVLLRAVKDFMEEKNCRTRIVLRTTGYLLSMDWARQTLLVSDEILVPVDAGPELRSIINEPLKNYTLSKLSVILRSIPPKYRFKISFELNLLRTGTSSNASPELIEEIIPYLKSSRIDKIIVKPVNRPGRDESIKPVRGRLIDKVVDIFSNEGFKVRVCRGESLEGVAVADNSDEAIYNHLLRKPLSTREIEAVYGVEGLVNAERMVEAGILEKKTWSGMIYFKPRVTIDYFNA